jgi:large subunit ribosomal protein L37Ae
LKNMARKTLKAGIVGKLGPRYGVKIRRRVQEIEEVQRQKHTCPRCLAKSVKRVSSGVWKCRRCGLAFAGGAYRPTVTTTIKRELPPAAEEAAVEAETEEAEAES